MLRGKQKPSRFPWNCSAQPRSSCSWSSASRPWSRCRSCCPGSSAGG